MSQSQELEKLVSLYTGQPTELAPREESSENQLIAALVSELRAMAEEDLKGGGQPVFIVRQPQRLPWILTAIMAACVGFLIALLVMKDKTPTAPPVNSAGQFEVRVLDPERSRIKITTGAAYSILHQVLPELVDKHGIDPKKVTSLVFSGEHIAIRNEDLRFLPHLKELALRNCRVDLGTTSLSTLTYLELTSCNGITQLDLTTAGQLEMVFAVRCPELTRIVGLGRQSGLVRMQVDRCPKLATLDGLEGLVNLELLELYECGLQPAEKLAKLGKLKVLYFDGDSPLDFQFFSHMTSLQRLSVNGKELKSLSGIETMTSLTDLLVRHPAEIDWTPLTDLSCRVYVEGISDEQMRRMPLASDRIFPAKLFWEQERTPYSE